jgi:hypothetical protein
MPAPCRFNDNDEILFRAECSSILDFSLVDFGTGFVDHDHASARAAVVKVDGDLMGDQISGLPGIVLVLAIEPDRVLETNAIGNIKMKNGHWDSSSGVNTPGLNLFRNSAGRSRLEIDGAKVPALAGKNVARMKPIGAHSRDSLAHPGYGCGLFPP